MIRLLGPLGLVVMPPNCHRTGEKKETREVGVNSATVTNTSVNNWQTKGEEPLYFVEPPPSNSSRADYPAGGDIGKKVVGETGGRGSTQARGP